MPIRHYPASSFRLCQVARAISLRSIRCRLCCLRSLHLRPIRQAGLRHCGSRIEDWLSLDVGQNRLCPDLQITTAQSLASQLHELLGVLRYVEQWRESTHCSPMISSARLRTTLRLRYWLDAAWSLQVLARLGGGDINGHPKYSESAHKHSPGIRLPRRLT